MKKLIMTSASIAILSASLIGCGTWNSMDSLGSTVVGTGAGVVGTTGYVVDSTVDNSVDWLVGRPASYNDMVVYRKNGMIYRHGHAYRIYHGKYVRVR